MIARVEPLVASDLERFLGLIWRPGDVREIRMPAPGRTDSGYFDNPAALIEAIRPFDGRENAYITINPVNDALLARAANRIKARARATTGDQQIIERRWLPIDIDPVRPSDISASEEEREAALLVARNIWLYLNGLGWPEPVAVMSGNGYWLLYPIELPNDAPAKAILDGILGHLADRFRSPAVSIDTTVSNASRIVALIGTMKVKGDATADRPHRRSGLLRMPKQIVPVARDLLEALAALAPKPTSSGPARSSSIITIAGDRMPAGWVGKALDTAGVKYRQSVRGGDTWYKLDACPFHPDNDQGGDCGVGEKPDGMAMGHCFHNRGAGKGWQEFRAALGLAVGAGAPLRPLRIARDGVDGPARSVGDGIDGTDLLALDLPPIRWIVPDLIPEGTTILAAPPKVGKSCLVYQIVAEAALGGELLGRKVERGSCLYLALEDGRRRGQQRLRAALAGRTLPRGFLEVRWDSRPIGGGIETDLVTWLDGHPDAVLVAIDTLQKVRPQSSGRRGAYEVDVEDLGRLQDLFRDRRVALLIVHHARKEAANDDFVASVSGTYGVTGSADTIVVVRRKRLELFGQIYVTGRDVEDAEIPVKFEDQLWSLAPESLAAASLERLEVYRVIEQSGGPVFASAIAEKTGQTRQSVQNIVGKLVGEGAVVRTKGGYVLAKITLKNDVSRGSDVSRSHFRVVSGGNDSLITPDVSDVRVVRDIADTGDTHARAREDALVLATVDSLDWADECHSYREHQDHHRRGPRGWFCLICSPTGGDPA